MKTIKTNNVLRTILYQAKLSLISYIIILFVVACSGGSTASASNNSGGNVIIQPSVVISTPAVIPVFANTATNAGLWIHNIDGKVITNIDINSSSTQQVFSSAVRRLIRKLPDVARHISFISNFNQSLVGQFNLDQYNVARCIVELNRGAGSQCYLSFITPVVKDSSGNGSVLLSVSTQDQNYSQIITWNAIASAAHIPNGSYFTAMPSGVTSGSYATVYAYVGASNSSGASKLNLTIAPYGAAVISNGYTNAMGVNAGQIIPVEIRLAANTASVKSKSITPSITLQSSLTNGDLTTSPSILSLSVTANNSANLLTSSIPSLFMLSSANYNNSYVVYVVNNGSVVANNINIVPSSGSVIEISNNTCGSAPLSAGAFCSYTVTADNPGTSSIDYSYTSGSSVDMLSIPSTQVQVFDNRVSGAYMSYTLPGTQSLAIAKGLPNESSTFSISFFNSVGSAESVQNFSIMDFINGSGANLSLANNNCPIILAPGDNCAVTFTVSSSSVESTKGYVGAHFSYNTMLSSAVISSYAGVQYAIYGDPFLVFINADTTLAQDNYAMKINGDLIESTTEKIWIINTGTESGIIESTIFAPSTNALAISSNNCTDGLVLAVNESCYFGVKLGPKLVLSTESGNNTYTVSYTNARFPDRYITYNNNVITFNWTILDLLPDFIITSVESSPAQRSGIGVVASPMMFTGALNNNGLQQLRITYQNTSSIMGVTNFAFNLAHLPSVLIVDPASTCGYSDNPVSIAAGASCSLLLDINRAVIPYLSSSAGVANLSFPYPSASWKIESIIGVDIESKFIFNNEDTFSGDYQSAVIQTVFTPNSGAWVSTQAIQSITNADGYRISTSSTFDAPLESGVFMLDNLSLCSYVNIRFLTISCDYNTTLSGGSAIGSWNISFIDPETAAALPAGLFNWLIVESAVDTVTPSNPIVYYNQYVEQLSR